MYKMDIEIGDLKKMLQECHTGYEYAKKHCRELVARPSTHTLYGPLDSRIGVSSPGNDVPARARKLTHKTRRKDYMIYELDENYKVLRTTRILDNCVEDQFHHFELDGVTFACRLHNLSNLYDQIFVLRYDNGKPVYCAELEYGVLSAHFYEYEPERKMYVTSYWYWPRKKMTDYGYPVDENAPFGAVNSPVERYYGEDVSRYIDFSYWFQDKK